MRCRLRVGKAMRIGKEIGRDDVVGGSVRGGTDHRVDLILIDGRIVSVYRDGKLGISRAFDRALSSRWPGLKRRDRIFFE